ncbi:MAG: DUF4870 domain-containing protein [Candidatus Binatia bacterium]
MSYPPGNNVENSSAPVMKTAEGAINMDDRSWGMMAHLSALVAMALGGMAFLGPLIIWLVKKEQSAFVADQAKEALNFQLSALIAALVCAATVIGIPLAFVVMIASIIYSIIAGIEANKGILYRYPYTFRMIS